MSAVNTRKLSYQCENAPVGRTGVVASPLFTNSILESKEKSFLVLLFACNPSP